MGLQVLTRPGLIFPNIPGSDRVEVLTAFARNLATEGMIDDPDDLYQRIWEREQLGSTGVGAGVAIPHCKLEGLDEILVAVGTCASEIDFDSADGKPVKVLFLVVSPNDSPAEHLRCLATISKWVKSEYDPERMLGEDDPEAIYQLLEEGDAS
jgi:PTS system nitrogen regulatory IIA component